ADEVLARAGRIAKAEAGSRSRFGPGASKVKLGPKAEMQRIGNETADVNEVLRRNEQGAAPNVTRSNAPFGKSIFGQAMTTPLRKINRDANNIVSEVISGSVLPSTKARPGRFRETLDSRFVQLLQEQASLRGAELKHSVSLSDRISRLLKLSDEELSRMESKITTSAKAVSEQKNAADTLLVDRGLSLDPKQAEARRLMPYALRHMKGVAYDGELGQFTRNGRPLSIKDILYDMERHGVDPESIAYVNTQQSGGSHFFTRYSGNRGSVQSGTFTGATFKRGAFPSKFENLVEQAAKDAGLVARAKAHDRIVSDYGITKGVKDGEPVFFSGKEAIRVARSMTEANLDGITYRALRVHPLTADRSLVEQFQSPKTSIDSTKLLSDWDNKRFETPKDTDLSVIVPDDLISRIRAHDTVGRPVLAPIGGAFRRTVLTTHTTWMTGNVVEATLRSGVSGVGPQHYLIGKRVMAAVRDYDVAAAARLEARALGGTMFGTQKRMAVRTPAGTMVRRIPILGQAVTGLEELTNAIFALNRFVERQYQTAALGKHVHRDIQEFTGSWIKATMAQKDILNDIAKGYLDEGKQIAAARMVDDVLGKYSKFDPGVRKAIQGYAIFLPWALNAVRFFTYTLPVKHPTISALLVLSERAIDQETKDASKNQPGNLNSELQVNGGVRQVLRFTPGGLFAGSATWNDKGGYNARYNPLSQSVAKQVLPEVSSALAMLAYGVNWKGQKATDRNGQPIGNRAALAVYQMFEALVPGLSIGRQYREHGGKPFDDSTIFSPATKPGTKGSKSFGDSFNPFRVVRTGKSFNSARPWEQFPAVSKGDSSAARPWEQFPAVEKP
ncbi:hypothetical protein UFOVP921_1, partial [uncultured Caudovirales phage]